MGLSQPQGDVRGVLSFLVQCPTHLTSAGSRYHIICILLTEKSCAWQNALKEGVDHVSEQTQSQQHPRSIRMGARTRHVGNSVPAHSLAATSRYCSDSCAAQSLTGLSVLP